MTIKTLKRKPAAKTYSVKINRDNIDETAKVKTSCRTFGGAMLDESGNFLYSEGMSKCKKCPGATKEACTVKLNPKIAFATAGKENFVGARTSKNGKFTSIKDFVGYCIDQGKYTRAQILVQFAKQFPEANKNQGGRYVTSAFNEKYSMKRWGKIAKRVENDVITWA